MKKKKKVPSYSQFLDVTIPEWRSRACGIVALKMAMDALGASSPDPDALIKKGMGMGAYDPMHGWRHKGLAEMARYYRLLAGPYDWTGTTRQAAFRRLKETIRRGPCLASIHKDFNPENGGHIIVVTRISKLWVFYNEPGARKRRSVRRKVPHAVFLAGWNQRGIIVKK